MPKDNHTRREVLQYSAIAGATTGLFTSSALGKSRKSSTNSVIDVRNQISFWRYASEAHWEVVAPEDKQFVFAQVSSEVPRSQFTLKFDGKSYRAQDTVAGVAIETIGKEISSNDGKQKIGFTIPQEQDVQEATIVWEDSEGEQSTLPVGNQFTKTTSGTPKLVVTAFKLPESAEKSTKFPVSVSVKNTGTADATFRASVTTAGPSSYSIPIEVSVPRGEEQTWTGELQYPITETKMFNLEQGKVIESSSVEMV